MEEGRRWIEGEGKWEREEWIEGYKERGKGKRIGVEGGEGIEDRRIDVREEKRRGKK